MIQIKNRLNKVLAILCVWAMFFTVLNPAFGQLDQDQLEALSIRNIGPAGMSGRVTAIDVNLRNDNIIYVGSASGGVWKTINGGTTWEPLFDKEQTLSIGSIKINQSNPDEIWVGTGEGNPRNSHNSGKGIYRSLDAGKTWQCMGLEETKVIHRIHIDPNNSQIVFAGALGSAWGKSTHRGVYRTTNGGESWEKILYKNDETGVADMIVDPSNPNKILVAMWEFGRKPWTFNSGGEGSGVFRTIDGGQHWTNLSEEDEGFPKGKIGRTGLAISASKPNVVYALVESETQGIYRSDDGGYNWRLQSDKNVGNRPFYYSEIYVDPSNENRIFNLWSYVSKSEDAGKNFTTIMDYGNDVHPDHHAFWIHPDKPDYMIDGNDGGLNISRDGGKNWRFVTNLPIGQFYHVNVDDDYPYNVYGGMQDNGSWVGPGHVLKIGGIRNADWQELYFGDGFDVAADPRNSRYGYAMSQQGNLAYWDRETGRTMPIQPAISDTTILRYNWNAPLVVDPFNDCGLYFGSQFVHHSTDCGYSWKTLSDDLTTNDREKQAASLKTGGLTMDVTGAENHTTLLSMAVSKLEEGVIWTGSDDGKLHISRDGGDSWTSLHRKLPGCPKNAWIPQISLSEINKGEAYIVVNNYRQNDWKPYLYHTKNYGSSFTRVVSDHQMETFVCSVLQDPIEERLVYLGTDNGLYISFDQAKSWTKWEEFPGVQIRDMVMQHTFDDLVIGTFGRSFWVIDDLKILRQMASTKMEVLKDSLVVFDPDPAYQNAYRSYDGIRFVAQAEYKGQNKARGAQFLVWKLGEKEEKSSSKAKKPNAKMYILNEANDTIRTKGATVKSGLNRLSWNLDQKGYNAPSWQEDAKDREPGGLPIKPGTYKMVLEHGTLKDSAYIEVNSDPRNEYNEKHFDAKFAMMEEHKAGVTQAKENFDRLKEAKQKITFINQYISLQEDSIQTEIKDQGKALNEQIDSLQQLFMLPKDTKGYVSSQGKLNPLIWQSRYYISSCWEEPQTNARIRLDKMLQKMEGINQGIDHFFDNEWKGYTERVEELPNVLFDQKD